MTEKGNYIKESEDCVGSSQGWYLAPEAVVLGLKLEPPRG